MSQKKVHFSKFTILSGILWRSPERAGLCVQGFNPGQSSQGSLPESRELTPPSEEVSSGPLIQIGWNPNTLGPESSGRAMRTISLAESEVSRRRKKLAAPSARGLRRSHPKGAAKASRGRTAASQARGSGETSASQWSLCPRPQGMVSEACRSWGGAGEWVKPRGAGPRPY